jgi:Ca2+-binding RTX toxin-like protein
VIAGGGGADRINAGGGRDLICAGPGDDFVDGGVGRDKIRGEAGADTIVGGPGGEVAIGGAGNDGVYGGQQDDVLAGSSGDDLLIGDHGKDTMRGEAGNDWLRGDYGANKYDGGPGSDTASFATDFSVNVGLSVAGAGAGGRSGFSGIENVVGSPGADNLRGDGVLGAAVVSGLGWVANQGQDRCTGFAVTDCGQVATGGVTPAVMLHLGGPDPGLTVLGGTTADTISLAADGGQVRVRDSIPLVAGPGCMGSGSNSVVCTVPSHLGYVTALGLAGDDSISVASDFGASTTVVLDGGTGTDRLTGGPGDEILFAGASDFSGPINGAVGLPHESLMGGGGDDAVLSGGVEPSDLHGGPGSDQLVAALACQGHLLDGGSGGSDIAGFALTGRGRKGIAAQIGGEAREEVWFGGCKPSRVASNNEILEGTDQNDVLMGDGGSNPLIIGHGGDDLIMGLGGADVLRGDDGRDVLLGGGGRDILDARDGERDGRLNCGGGGERAIRDHRDPRANGCH